jgi:hypothetical protein
MVYAPFLFGGILVAVGIVGEVSGFRALVCSKSDDKFVLRLVVTAGLYVVVAWLIGILLIP